MHPHLAREAVVQDVETTRYGRDYARRRGKITHVDKDLQAGAATGYVLRMEDGGNEDQDSFAHRHGSLSSALTSRRVGAGVDEDRAFGRVHHLCGDAPEPHPSDRPEIPAAHSQ